MEGCGRDLAGRVPRNGRGGAAGVDQRLAGPGIGGWWQRRRPACLKRPAPDRSRADGAMPWSLTRLRRYQASARPCVEQQLPPRIAAREIGTTRPDRRFTVGRRGAAVRLPIHRGRQARQHPRCGGRREPRGRGQRRARRCRAPGQRQGSEPGQRQSEHIPSRCWWIEG